MFITIIYPANIRPFNSLLTLEKSCCTSMFPSPRFFLLWKSVIYPTTRQKEIQIPPLPSPPHVDSSPSSIYSTTHHHKTFHSLYQTFVAHRDPLDRPCPPTPPFIFLLPSIYNDIPHASKYLTPATSFNSKPSPKSKQASTHYLQALLPSPFPKFHPEQAQH